MAYRFGAFELSPERRLLLRAGERVELTPKALQFLEVLVRRRPNVVSKDEIQDVLWPETYVLEANIPNLVAEIRAALGESAREPRYVRTVSGVGYAFDGTAIEQAPEAAAAADPAAACSITVEGKTLVLREGENLIGRGPTADVAVPRATVSRRHAVVRVRGTTAVIEDLGSRNGTFLRARRLTGPATLSDGDDVQVGDVVLRFRLPTPLCSTDEFVLPPPSSRPRRAG